MSGLTFEGLRAVNVERGTAWHGEGGLERWSPLEWAGALCGEAGELANVAKKMKRIEDDIRTREGEGDYEVLRAKLADECADVLIYLDLLAARCEIDLGAAVVRKFNRTSVDRGFPHRLPEKRGSTPECPHHGDYCSGADCCCADQHPAPPPEAPPEAAEAARICPTIGCAYLNNHPLPCDGIDSARPGMERWLIAGPATPGRSKAKEQAEKVGDWRRNEEGGPECVRFYDDPGYVADDEDGDWNEAAYVDDHGWRAYEPDGETEIARGEEPLDLGMCLADLALCSRGHLAWERVRWASQAHAREAASYLWEHGHKAVTPATLDRVLAAVRSASGGDGDV